jgi:NADH-quinone oxidoreductase subunit C
MPRLQALVQARLGPAHPIEPLGGAPGCPAYRVGLAHLIAIATFLRDDPDAGFETLLDLTGVDHGAVDHDDPATPRFTLLVTLENPLFGGRLRLETALHSDEPTFPSLSALWPAATVLEREVSEMFGFHPEGHPDPRPLLLPDGFVGHPLRRDYRKDKAQPLVPPPKEGPRLVVESVPPDGPEGAP